jgi:hypothetical protein
MKKTLAAIINHNARAYTDQLYQSLVPYRRDDYDIMVMDNGSTNPNEVSSYTTHKTGQNTYYGGALNLIFREFLSLSEYDSLMVFNNDIILHGYNFIQDFRDASAWWHVLSPSVIQPEQAQCTWKQMHVWGRGTPRTVKWVDFMCPFFRREVVEEIQQYDMELIYGWGQDIWTGVVCEQMDWKMAVMDTQTVIHMSSQTYKDGRSNISSNEYANRAGSGMVNYFNRIGMFDKLQEFRHYGETYSI